MMDARRATEDMRRWAIAGVCLGLSCCGNPAAPGAQPPAGMWGGTSVRLDITAAGATVEYDCAHGTIDEPVLADRDGRFSASGTHVREHGGPTRLEEPPDRHPARYEGQFTGNSVRFTLTLLDTNQPVGPFSATFGQTPRLFKCL